MRPDRYSVFDYTITVTRKHRYLVVGSPEFGFQVAAEVVGLGQADPRAIGESVLKVMDSIHRQLHELELEGKPHPVPVQRRPLSRLKARGELLACREAARTLGISRATLRKMVYSGQIKAERTPGGHLRFTLEALSDYLTGAGAGMGTAAAIAARTAMASSTPVTVVGAGKGAA